MIIAESPKPHYPMYYKNRILNPGSVGQPRDGNWMPHYAILPNQTIYRII